MPCCRRSRCGERHPDQPDDNAIKYTPDEAKKIESAVACQPYVVVEVEDNGIGIAPGIRNISLTILQGHRGDLAHQAKGSGLGLNLVNRMMKEHGGSVSVRSHPGEGSTFILKFPAKSLHHV